MSKLAELHAQKAIECVNANTQEKVEDEFHAELTLDMMTKLTVWMSWLSQQENPIAFATLEEYIQYFIEHVYKPTV